MGPELHVWVSQVRRERHKPRRTGWRQAKSRRPSAAQRRNVLCTGRRDRPIPGYYFPGGRRAGADLVAGPPALAAHVPKDEPCQAQRSAGGVDGFEERRPAVRQTVVRFTADKTGISKTLWHAKFLVQRRLADRARIGRDGRHQV